MGHRDNPDIPCTPRREEIDPILLSPRQPIELPDHDGRNGARVNSPLETRKRGPTEGLAALDIFKPLDCRQVVSLVRKPAGEFRLLTVRLVGPGLDPTIAGNHTKPPRTV